MADVSDCGITLMMPPLDPAAEAPKFKACAKHPKTEESGFVLYYTDQCPFTFYWVPRVEEAAQKVPAPVTTYALFRDGQFVTQGIQSDKKFLALSGIRDR